jgi:hypothetical protein
MVAFEIIQALFLFQPSRGFNDARVAVSGHLQIISALRGGPNGLACAGP